MGKNQVSGGRSENFKTEFARMMASWPLQPERVKPLSDEYRAIYDRVGPVRFKRAVDFVIRQHRSDFFPSPGIFEGHVPSGEARVERCGECQNTQGWLYVQVEGEKEPRVKKCLHGAA